MLTLSRKRRQQLLIGDNITVHIISIRPGAVRIGIEAPKEIPVIRGELLGDFIEVEPQIRTNFTSGSPQ